MKNTLKAVAATAVVAIGLGMGSAQAGPINGGISFSDGFSSFASGPAIVSTLNSIDVQAVAATFGSCSTDFGGCSFLGSSFDFTIVPPGVGTVIYAIDGFTFTLTSVSSIVRTAYSCDVQGNCTDALTFAWAGFVSKVGFDDTLWNGNWTGNGACSGTAAGCTGNNTSSWSSSIVAQGHPRETPEPATLALLGLGLAGIGFAFRRKQA
jgi:hypothetical protein